MPRPTTPLQEAWLRISKTDASDVGNLAAWLTTVVGRVCLNALRARNARREEPMEAHVPDPVISPAGGTSPEAEALMADSVGLALYIVLETLTPAERLAFVLHDMFDVPFDEIAPLIGRSAVTARQLASRARRRVRGADVQDADPDIARQREAVDAFFAAAHHGDFDALVVVLDPDIVVRVDGGTTHPEASVVLRGAPAVAARALTIAQPSAPKLPVLVNGAAGVVAMVNGKPFAVIGFTVAHGKIVEIAAIVGPERLARFDLSFLTEASETR